MNLLDPLKKKKEKILIKLIKNIIKNKIKLDKKSILIKINYKI